MTADLTSGLELGTAADAEDKASYADWPGLALWQWVIPIAFASRFGAGRVAQWWLGEREGEVTAAIGYLQPFFVAFLIWPVIYGFQAIFCVWQFLQKPGVASERRLAAIQGVAPWWCAMSAITVAWNFAPNLWLAGVGLTGVVVTLFFAHAVVAGEMESPDYWVMNVPITMHLGWGTAAALLTWNGVVAESTTSFSINIAWLVIELALAAGLGSFVAMRRRSALLVWMVAWAVMWIGVMTLFPFPAGDGRLEKYNAELGETGRYALGAAELFLAVGLLAMGCLARGQGVKQRG